MGMGKTLLATFERFACDDLLKTFARFQFLNSSMKYPGIFAHARTLTFHVRM